MNPFLTTLNRINPTILARLENSLKSIPSIQQKIERQYDDLLDGIEEDLHPYRQDFPPATRLPESGRDRGAILDEMAALAARERERWADGYASGAVYHGNTDHIDFLNRVYALASQTNPLHADLWPSITKFEAEIVAMTAHMLGAEAALSITVFSHDALLSHDVSSNNTASQVCGTVTSGGTESILLAMKSYRDQARAERGIKRPEMVVPVTAHAAFEKAAHYFGIKLVQIPVDADFKADVDSAAAAINKRTIALVGSAPSFPHGVIDPIADLSELARQRGIGFHTDACLGGFVLPWAEKLGYDVPPFDFRLSGVTSMSADTHKYGYAAKGTSVVLYRTPELRRYQYYTAANWPGGLYYSPTLAGSRPGALSAACWAAMMAMSEDGYTQATAKILAAAGYIRIWIDLIPDLHVLGDPLWVIAFSSDTLDIYQVMEQMRQRGWSLNGLHRPAAVHLAVTLRHTEPGVAQRFINDLRYAVAHVKAHPQEKSGMAPVYGLAANLPMRGLIGDMLERYVDLLYKTQ